MRVNAQSGKGWCSPLTETNVAETWWASDLETTFNVDGIGHAGSSMGKSQNLDELGSWRMDFFGILVAVVIAKPNIVT
jgi:hypothetical protein